MGPWGFLTPQRRSLGESCPAWEGSAQTSVFNQGMSQVHPTLEGGGSHSWCDCTPQNCPTVAAVQAEMASGAAVLGSLQQTRGLTWLS